MCGARHEERNSGTGVAKVCGYKVNPKTAAQFIISSVCSSFYYCIYIYISSHLSKPY